MERSGSQKALFVLSIIEIVVAAIAFIGGALMAFGGGVLGMASSEELAEVGTTVAEAGVVGGAVAILGTMLIVSAVVSLLCGIFGIRAANDANKVMPVWVVTLIELILTVISIVYAIVNGSFGSEAFSLVVSAVFAALMFWIANNIRNQRTLR